MAERMLIVKVVRTGATQADLYAKGHKWPDLKLFDLSELAEVGITLEAELVAPGPQILMDERYMKQAVLNLLNNAISAMPEGGRLRVQTEQQGNEVCLKISDSGVGIPEENMDKIFEPYFTTKDFGSGLGLTLVYKIVKEHLGDIEINSKVGEGTTIALSFPIPQKEKRLIGYSEEVQ